MKNIILSLFFILFISLISSCGLIYEKETTNNVSFVSIKPVMELLGEPIISMQQGGTYTEEGVVATAGDTILDYEIYSGNVEVNEQKASIDTFFKYYNQYVSVEAPNPQVQNFYVVTYKSTNGFGWSSYAYRTVLVHDGTPEAFDLEGIYKKGFFFETQIEPYPINGVSGQGYWKINNVWSEEGVSFPLVIADTGDGIHFGVVPKEHVRKGLTFGYAVRNGSTLYFKILSISKDGIATVKDFDWTKQ